MRLASDEREHRRGLVLGLTMAEVLLLLLFLLLLALAARLMTQAKDLAKANETVQVLRPLIEAVKGGDQIRGETIQALAQDLASVPQLKRDNETLKVALADTTRRLDAYRQVEARARELNPNDPPAALRSGLELLAKHGELSVRAEALSRLEKDAQAVDPSSPPQQTIQNALTFMKSAGQFGADVKMAGQIRQQVAVLKDTEQKIDERMKAAFGGSWRNGARCSMTPVCHFAFRKKGFCLIAATRFHGRISSVSSTTSSLPTYASFTISIATLRKCA
jgi:hypothetical protein